jgi:ATP-dependent Lon protease
VLPVGGIKEKALAAKRGGVREIVFPKGNEADVHEELPDELREGIAFTFVSHIDEALERAFDGAAQARSAQRDGVRAAPLTDWAPRVEKGDESARS